MSDSKIRQSTDHLLMIEPAAFFANPETMETNAYQVDDGVSHEEISAKALVEFQGLRDKLIEVGVAITCVQGLPECPDMVFPNWFFTLPDRRLMLCPMLNENRRKERLPQVVDLLSRMYDEVIDWTDYEAFDLPLESTASIVSDRVNKKCYAALSARTDEGLARKWAEYMGYEIHFFQTQSHKGIPVYHTDCTMWIGETLAGFASDCVIDEDRESIVNSLKSTHELILFSNEQLRAFCGNALEVIGRDNKKYLVMSSTGYNALTDAQIAICEKHFSGIVHSPLQTLEKYGGGSARCMLAELM